MPIVNFKHDGRILNKDFDDFEIKELSSIIEFSEKILDLIYRKENINIELNLVIYPNLGKELLRDNRIRIPLEIHKEDFTNHYDQLRGVKVNPAVLKEEYKDLNLCYASMVKDVSVVENLLSILHEICHYVDPYPLNELREDDSFDYEKRSKCILDDFFAEYRTYTLLPFLVKRFGITQDHLNRISSMNMTNLFLKLNFLKKNLKIFYSIRIKDIFYDYIRLILILFGSWSALYEIYGNIDYLEKKWLNLINIIKSEISITFAEILDDIKKESLFNLRNRIKESKTETLSNFQNFIENFFEIKLSEIVEEFQNTTFTKPN